MTVTLKVQLELFPAASVAVQVTVLVPLLKVDPLSGVHRMLPPGQLSVKLAKKLTLLEHWPDAAFTVMSLGQCGTGLSGSVIVTVKLHSAVWPATSVTWRVLVVTPFGNNEPLARPDVRVVVEPGQLSL